MQVSTVYNIEMDDTKYEIATEAVSRMSNKTSNFDKIKWNVINDPTAITDWNDFQKQ